MLHLGFLFLSRLEKLPAVALVPLVDVLGHWLCPIDRSSKLLQWKRRPRYYQYLCFFVVFVSFRTGKLAPFCGGNAGG
jgi:hypothetical protein